MTLPEMDFASKPPAEPLRLRTPSPATVGAGPGGLPRGGSGTSPGFPAKPTASSDEPPDWKSIGERLKYAELARGDDQAYTNMFANVAPGYKPNAHAGEAGVNIAKQALELPQAQQQFERGALANQTAKAGLEVKAAKNDRNSLQSQKAREGWRAFFGKDVPEPPGFNEWTAADIENFAKTGDMTHLIQAKRQRDEDARKVAGGQEKAAAEKAALDGSRKAYSGELKALGIDPTTASQKDIDRAISVGHNKATEAQAKATYALAAKGEGRKEGDYAALGESIPFAGTELKYTGKGTPRSDDVDKAQATASLYGAAISGMNDLEKSMDAFAKNPSVDTRDAVIAKTQAVSGHLNTAAGQGAMSKDEKAEMEKALGVNILTPGGVQAIVDRLTGNDAQAAADMTRRLQAVRQSTRAAALGKLEPYHFAPVGGGEGPKTPGGKPYAKKQVSPSTGRVRYLDKSGSVIEETGG
jgi:hypothetical protein